MPPRDSIKRVTTFTRAGDPATQSDGLTLDGYAAVFRQETLIDSWEGRFFESLAPGSTKKTLSRDGPPAPVRPRHAPDDRLHPHRARHLRA